MIRFEKKILHRQGLFFPDDHFEYQYPYVIFKIEHFITYFCLSQYFIVICVHKPYFYIFKCNFDSLEWQFGTYCFYVDLEISSKIKLICVPTHYYWSIPFSAVNSVFLTSSHVCQICVTEVLIIDFLQQLPCKVFNTIWVANWGRLLGGWTLDPAEDPYLGCNLLTLI